jgi:hypothetical protein
MTHSLIHDILALRISEVFMSITTLQDENLRRLYENVREQAEADRGSRYKFASNPSVKQYATALREEMIRRRLQHLPIEWD